MSDETNLRNVRQLAAEKDAARDGAAPDGDLLTWGALDILTSSVWMFAAFTGRSIRRGSTDSVVER